jgi:hypothetical protein
MALRDRLRATSRRLRRPAGREAGIALILTTVALAVLIAVTSELAYNTRVEVQLAANAQNELRAHYLAESALQLGQAAVAIQQMIDRFGSQVGLAGMVRVGELVDILLPVFNQKDAGMLGSLLGVDASAIKGLGVEGGSFDLKVGFEDGKINVNCAGGLDQATDTPQKKALGAVLWGLFASARYRPLFENPNSEGQYVKPEELMAAIVDWVDIDEQLFQLPNAGTAPEDYRYDARRDRYLARNYFVDTPQELRMVRGMSDDMWASFGDYLTAYGPCRINLAAINEDHWPLVEGIIRAFAAPDDPVARDERKLEALAQYVTPMLGFSASSTGTSGGKQASGVDSFVQLVQNPTQGVGLMGQAVDGVQTQIEGVKLQQVETQTGVKLADVVGSGRKVVFRLEATGESGAGCLDPKRGTCSRRKITAIFNSAKMAINSQQAKQGVWVYWREE